MLNFQACDWGGKGLSSSVHIYGLYPSRHTGIVYRCLKEA